MGANVELHLEPSSDRFDALDDRWLDQVAGLVTELDEQVGGVERATTTVEGTKGIELAAIILALGSAGVFTAAIEVVKSWLQRDDTRSMRVVWSDSGELKEVELKGSDVSDAAVQNVLRSVASQLAEAT
ncbi:MAG: hypothetical protein ABWZ26_05320 [Candidatus Nanopelagicales bacterium]